jgi:aconitate hydratase
VPAGVSSGQEEFTVSVNDGEWEFTADLDASDRERDILSAGGKLSWVKQQHADDGSGAAPADD